MDSIDILLKYFPDLTDEQIDRFSSLKSLYEYWNDKINVISRKDMDNFYLHHVLHSLAIAKVAGFNCSLKVMDAGTGGGFPGIPLAILFPGTEFYLVDSIGKKIKVVNKVVNNLQLKNVCAEQIRMEQVKGTFDFIVSRAVTDLEKFVKWTIDKISGVSKCDIENGILYLKGGEISDEIKRTKRIKKVNVKLHGINKFFSEPYFENKYVVHVFK